MYNVISASKYRKSGQIYGIRLIPRIKVYFEKQIK